MKLFKIKYFPVDLNDTQYKQTQFGWRSCLAINLMTSALTLFAFCEMFL